MSPQITKILPKSAWDTVTVSENHEPVVDVYETEKLVFGKGLAPHKVTEFRVRKIVADMLYVAAGSLPTEYKLALVEGVRSLSKQQEHWDRKVEEFKKTHPEWSDAEVEYQVRLVVAKPLPLANHNCGGAVDVTLVDMHGNPVDMGTMPQALVEKEVVEMFSRFITEEQAGNRKILRDAMECAGFVWYPGEWWHYCYGDRMWAVYTERKECGYGPVEFIRQ